MNGIDERSGAFHVELWRPAKNPEYDIEMLAEVLHEVVHAGAGVSFVLPFSPRDARDFWLHRTLPGVRDGSLRVLIARSAGRIVGTVTLAFPWPPNQPHRAEVAKLLVHPAFRRRGIARKLMTALEDAARSEQRSLLTLDTWTGGPAEALYRSLGYVVVGVIPRFARPSTTREPEPTTIMYKEISLDRPPA
jgi:ribosomal protein S18 acetylase RimI-like enzyme